MKGRALHFQTNLLVTYIDQPYGFTNPYEFANVHPDNHYEIKDGFLSFETLSGEEIIYIPADKIMFFHTVCEKVEA
jgi:hypothetical protein